MGLEPAIPDKEGRHAKHPAIGDVEMASTVKSFDLSGTMHGYVTQGPALAERDVSNSTGLQERERERYRREREREREREKKEDEIESEE